MCRPKTLFQILNFFLLTKIFDSPTPIRISSYDLEDSVLVSFFLLFISFFFCHFEGISKSETLLHYSFTVHVFSFLIINYYVLLWCQVTTSLFNKKLQIRIINKSILLHLQRYSRSFYLKLCMVFFFLLTQFV